MKRLFILITVCTLWSCSSDDSEPAVFDPNITVNGNDFEIKYALLYSETFEGTLNTQFVLGYTQECTGCPYPPQYERLLLNLKTDPSESIEGTYEVASSPDMPGTITGGYYLSGYPISLYTGTVTISKLGTSRYKLQFNTVKGHFYLNPNMSQKEIEGYFDGNFEEIEEPFSN